MVLSKDDVIQMFENRNFRVLTIFDGLNDYHGFMLGSLNILYSFKVTFYELECIVKLQIMIDTSTNIEPQYYKLYRINNDIIWGAIL